MEKAHRIDFSYIQGQSHNYTLGEEFFWEFAPPPLKAKEEKEKKKSEQIKVLKNCLRVSYNCFLFNGVQWIYPIMENAPRKDDSWTEILPFHV